MAKTAETMEFQAEAKQLLQLMVHSIYSNKDIFLRELISNGSDALDKLRLEALLNSSLIADTSDLHVFIEPNAEARTLTVRDNGIGMTRDEVVSLIGTIAKSGTAEFVRLLKESKEKPVSSELIGQFGVGFYSSFMVADRVELITRRAGEVNGTRFESTGDGTYTLEEVEAPPQGTSVTLHLKPEDKEDNMFDYTSVWKIRDIVKTYSDFIAYPIRMKVQHQEPGETPEAAPKLVDKVETLNSMKAIWARPKDEVKEEEYREFYKHVSHDWNDPLKTIHLKAEGTFEYQALLFLPSKAPFDLFMREAKHGIQLFVKRVFIMDNCEELMPDYMRFVRGVVDAQDLSLNVSREILQKDRHIQMMRKRLVKKVLDTLKDMLTDEVEKYHDFWKEFGRVIKEGIYQDYDNRDALLGVSLFPSTNGAELTSLKGYIERMKEGQDTIYFLTGENRSSVENSPHLETFKANGYEVLLLTDPIDEIWTGSVTEYEGKKLVSAAKGTVDLGTEDDKKKAEADRESAQKDYATLLAWMKTRLAERVKEVRLSSRLTESPACLVGDANDMTPTMEKLMKAMGQEAPKVKRILELNPSHNLVTRLKDAYDAKKDDPILGDTVQLIYGMALLAEGGELEEPARFSKLLSEVLARSL